jgi:hypothetical protein
MAILVWGWVVGIGTITFELWSCMVREERTSLHVAYHVDTSPSTVLQAVSQEIQDKLDCC